MTKQLFSFAYSTNSFDPKFYLKNAKLVVQLSFKKVGKKYFVATFSNQFPGYANSHGRHVYEKILQYIARINSFTGYEMVNWYKILELLNVFGFLFFIGIKPIALILHTKVVVKKAFDLVLCTRFKYYVNIYGEKVV